MLTELLLTVAKIAALFCGAAIVGLAVFALGAIFGCTLMFNALQDKHIRPIILEVTRPGLNYRELLKSKRHAMRWGVRKDSDEMQEVEIDA